MKKRLAIVKVRNPIISMVESVSPLRPSRGGVSVGLAILTAAACMEEDDAFDEVIEDVVKDEVLPGALVLKEDRRL
jgi:hypothetical protein